MIQPLSSKICNIPEVPVWVSFQVLLHQTPTTINRGDESQSACTATENTEHSRVLTGSGSGKKGLANGPIENLRPSNAIWWIIDVYGLANLTTD